MRLFLFLLASAPFFLFATEDVPVWVKDSVQARIAEQVVLFPQEKLHLQTDRSTYVAGDQLWFRAFLVDATLHMPSYRSAYVDVELINPMDSVVNRIRVKQFEDAFSGSLTLPANLEEGTYVIRAFTNHLQMLGEEYFFHRLIRILHPHLKANTDEKISAGAKKENFTLFFYPEGGYIVEGVPSRVAFKALHPDGSPADIRGRLIDHEGTDYGPIETLHDGMGVFDLLALPGMRYLVVSEDDRELRQEFEVPMASSEAYGLQVSTMDDELSVSVLHPPGKAMVTPLYLVLHTRGMVHYAAAWDPSYSTLLFDTSDFPSGVVQILLLDGQSNALSERLYFCRNDDDARLFFQPDKTYYNRRSLVKSTITLTNERGAPVSGSFAISVTDDRDVSADEKTNILSSLLLDSELKGYIADPAFYFKDGSRQALDLLMMTHGWRRYDIPKALSQHYVDSVASVQYGMEIRGKVSTDSRGKPAVGSRVSLVSWNTDFSEETVTDALGHFVFDGFEFPDSLTFIVQANPARGRNNPVLEIARETFPPVPGSLTASLTALAQAAAMPEEIIDRNQVIKKSAQQNRVSHDQAVIAIDEVTVNTRFTHKMQDKNYSFYMPDNDRYNILTSEQLEEIQPMNVSDALKHLPFLMVMEDIDNRKKVYIERMRLNSLSAVAIEGLQFGLPAALIVDDMIINDYDIDNILDPSNIEKIGVLKGTAASILGGEGAGGAIVITTKKGLSRSPVQDMPQEHIKLITPLGYQVPAEFYSPAYETPDKLNQPEVDSRTTIYWNPNVKISSSGHAEINFYTADGDSTYSVVIEGVTDQGLLIRHKSKIIQR